MNSDIQKIIREKYSDIAASDLSNNDRGVQAVAEAFGYTAEELTSIPAEANMGLSCGNPTATAKLRPGEVVLDMGCGGGLDVFLAAQKVGPAGKVIGLDMTPAMIERARRNLISGVDGHRVSNIEFLLGAIDQIPIPNQSVDCIISNCVINLASDKPAVFREMFRVLKPGGRVAVSDIALKKALPPELGNNLLAYVGCIAGAIQIDKYRQWMTDAGFRQVTVVDTEADLNAYSKIDGRDGCCASSTSISSTALPIASGGCCASNNASVRIHGETLELLKKYDLNEYAASVKILTQKPATA